MIRKSLVCFFVLLIIILNTACSKNKVVVSDLDTTTQSTEGKVPVSQKNEATLSKNTTTQSTEGKVPVSKKTETTFAESTTKTSVTEKTTSNEPKDDLMNDRYSLIVKGEFITQVEYIKHNENGYNAFLPFKQVLVALGINIQDKSDTVCEFTVNGQKYVLDTQKVLLVKESDSFNWIMPTPGSKVHYKCADGELFLDDITVRTVFMALGINAKINVDHQKLRVEIV